MHPEHRIEIGPLPRDTASFLALRDRLAQTPFGGAAIHVVAVALTLEDRALGLPCLTAALDASHLVDGPSGLSGKQPSPIVLRDLRDRLEGKPWVARSYFEGTSPSNGYALPASLSVRIREQPADVGESSAKVFVFSSGADSPRPIRLLKSPKGYWKSKEWSSLEVGVRPPAVAPAEDI
jgi:hypothetical protein